MNITESIKALSVIGEVTSTRWETIMNIVDSINNDKKTVVLEKEWYDNFRNKNLDRYPLDLSNRKTWSTFDETCIDIRFSIEDKKLVCVANIYDGDNFGGRRENLKFTTKIQFPNKFIKRIGSLLEYEFSFFLEREYNAHLELKQRIWMTDMRNELLK